MTPFDKARELILSLTTSEDAHDEIEKIKNTPQEKQKEMLEALYSTAEKKAFKGDTKAISIILRTLEYFGDKSHDRMLLHYIAQAASNQALEELKSETHPNHGDMVKALTLISEAFADADQINDAKK